MSKKPANPMKPDPNAKPEEAETEENKTAEEAQEPAAGSDKLEEPAEEKTEAEGPEFSTPAAQKFAEQAVEKHGIDIKAIKGTGAENKIVKKDVEAAISEAKKAKAAEEAEAPADDEDEAPEEGDSEVDYNDPESVAKEFEAILTEIVSFSVPIRGALHSKPNVQGRWNDLTARVVKVKRIIEAAKKAAGK